MKRERQITEYECDGCGRRDATPPGCEPPLGYYGSVSEIHGGGGSGGDFYACSPRCIKKAVLRGIEIGSMNPDEYEELLRS